MRYFLFLDESGDHGLKTIDPSFPAFILCGVLIEESQYRLIKNKLNSIKENFWKNTEVIFHSRDIRKCEKEFQILFDLEVKKKFYNQINSVIKDSEYTVISAAIKKTDYIKRYGKQSDNVYGIALSFIVERTVYCLDELKENSINVQLVIEKRGKNEDKTLNDQFQLIRSNGTYYVNSDRINGYGFGFHFRSKKNNVNGLQLADLIAYPIARHVIEPKRPHPSFELFKNKIYGETKKFGLKIFP